MAYRANPVILQDSAQAGANLRQGHTIRQERGNAAFTRWAGMKPPDMTWGDYVSNTRDSATQALRLLMPENEIGTYLDDIIKRNPTASEVDLMDINNTARRTMADEGVSNEDLYSNNYVISSEVDAQGNVLHDLAPDDMKLVNTTRALAYQPQENTYPVSDPSPQPTIPPVQTGIPEYAEYTYLEGMTPEQRAAWVNARRNGGYGVGGENSQVFADGKSSVPGMGAYDKATGGQDAHHLAAVGEGEGIINAKAMQNPQVREFVEQANAQFPNPAAQLAPETVSGGAPVAADGNVLGEMFAGNNKLGYTREHVNSIMGLNPEGANYANRQMAERYLDELFSASPTARLNGAAVQDIAQASGLDMNIVNTRMKKWGNTAGEGVHHVLGQKYPGYSDGALRRQVPEIIEAARDIGTRAPSRAIKRGLGAAGALLGPAARVFSAVPGGIDDALMGTDAGAPGGLSGGEMPPANYLGAPSMGMTPGSAEWSGYRDSMSNEVGGGMPNPGQAEQSYQQDKLAFENAMANVTRDAANSRYQAERMNSLSGLPNVPTMADGYLPPSQRGYSLGPGINPENRAPTTYHPNGDVQKGQFYGNMGHQMNQVPLTREQQYRFAMEEQVREAQARNPAPVQQMSGMPDMVSQDGGNVWNGPIGSNVFAGGKVPVYAPGYSAGPPGNYGESGRIAQVNQRTNDPGAPAGETFSASGTMTVDPAVRAWADKMHANPQVIVQVPQNLRDSVMQVFQSEQSGAVHDFSQGNVAKAGEWIGDAARTVADTVQDRIVGNGVGATPLPGVSMLPPREGPTDYGEAQVFNDRPYNPEIDKLEVKGDGGVSPEPVPQPVPDPVTDPDPEPTPDPVPEEDEGTEEDEQAAVEEAKGWTRGLVPALEKAYGALAKTSPGMAQRMGLQPFLALYGEGLPISAEDKRLQLDYMKFAQDVRMDLANLEIDQFSAEDLAKYREGQILNAAAAITMSNITSARTMSTADKRLEWEKNKSIVQPLIDLQISSLENGTEIPPGALEALAVRFGPDHNVEVSYVDNSQRRGLRTGGEAPGNRDTLGNVEYQNLTERAKQGYQAIITIDGKAIVGGYDTGGANNDQFSLENVENLFSQIYGQGAQ